VDFQDRDKSASAADMFEKAIALKPGDPDAHFYRGYNLSALERYEEAADEFRKALALKPDMARAKAQLEVAGKFAAETLLKEAAERMGRAEYYGAHNLYGKAALYDPASAEAKQGAKDAAAALEKDTRERAARARGFVAAGEYAKARAELGALEKANPDAAETAALRKEYEEKSASAKQACLAQARVAEEREALGEALRLYGLALKIDPADPNAAESAGRLEGVIADERRRAKAALSGGDLVTARKGYERLVKYLPDDDEARRGLREVSSLVEAETARWLERAKEALAAGDVAKAGANVEKALELSPQGHAAQNLRKKIRERALELDKAQAAEPAQAAEAPEEEVRRLYLLGVEHYTRGELKEAIASWREVLRLDPGNDKALASIGKAEDKLREAAGKPAQQHE